MDSRSRSAGSPALPTAMTIRPQLASSPAMAVFTSGEFANPMAPDLLQHALSRTNGDHATERKRLARVDHQAECDLFDLPTVHRGPEATRVQRRFERDKRAQQTLQRRRELEHHAV